MSDNFLISHIAEKVRQCEMQSFTSEYNGKQKQ